MLAFPNADLAVASTGDKLTTSEPLILVIALITLAKYDGVDAARMAELIRVAQYKREARLCALRGLLLSLHFNKCKLVGLETGIRKSEIVVLMVDHSEFYAFDTSQLKDKVVIDLKGIWNNQ